MSKSKAEAMNLPAITSIMREGSIYPAVLGQLLGRRAPRVISAVCDVGILRNREVALFCSVKCPGELILKTYDYARELRDEGTTVISGFHSPMEKECLRILLRGKQPLIICPARSLHGMRLPWEWRLALAQGRLLLLSPFARRHRRVTARLAVLRNEFAAALADEVFIAHAQPGSKSEALAKRVVAWGKPLMNPDACAKQVVEVYRQRHSARG